MSAIKNLDIDWDKISQAFRAFLQMTKNQIIKILNWLKENPEKLAIIVIAVSRLFSGDYSGLFDIASLIFS